METTQKGELAAANARLKLQEAGKDLISGNSTFADLGNKIAESGEIEYVQIHFSKPTVGICMGKIDSFPVIRNESLDTFVKTNGTAYTMIAFPEIMKKARSIEESLRAKRKKCSVGSSDYMELTTFSEVFLPFYQKKMEDLEELKQELIKVFPEEMPAFVANITALAKTVFATPEESSAVIKEVNRIAAKGGAGLASGLKCELLTDFKAEKMSTDELKKLVEEANKARAKKLVTDILEGTLQDCYDATAMYLAYLDKAVADDISSHYARKDALRAQAEKSARENIGNIDFITEVTGLMKKLAAENNRLQAVDDGFDLASTILGAADALGITLVLPKSKPEWFTERNIRDNMAYLSA